MGRLTPEDVCSHPSSFTTLNLFVRFLARIFIQGGIPLLDFLGLKLITSLVMITAYTSCTSTTIYMDCMP
jgi:hypothetical protein